MLKKVSRSSEQNFESDEGDTNQLQLAVSQYEELVRNVSSDSIIQFDYGVEGEFPSGEPVGELAATALLDSSPRVVLYLNRCDCGREFCRENASWVLKNLLKKVSLRDTAVEFLIEYKNPSVTSESAELGNGLVGHIHLSKDHLYKSNINMRDILDKCGHEVNTFWKKKKKFSLLQNILLSVSCAFTTSNQPSSHH